MDAIFLIRDFISQAFFNAQYGGLSATWDLFVVNLLVVGVIIFTAFIIFAFFRLLFHLVGG